MHDWPAVFDLWLEWTHEHRQVLWWLTGFSMAMSVAGVIGVPMLIARIPHDYFAYETPPRSPWADRSPLLRGLLLVIKNGLGLLLVLAGITMLVLPGQGLVAIAVGIAMMDFPGRYRLGRWLVSRPWVLRSINWLRRRQRKPLLRVGPTTSASECSPHAPREDNYA